MAWEKTGSCSLTVLIIRNILLWISHKHHKLNLDEPFQSYLSNLVLTDNKLIINRWCATFNIQRHLAFFFFHFSGSSIIFERTTDGSLSKHFSSLNPWTLLHFGLNEPIKHFQHYLIVLQKLSPCLILIEYSVHLVCVLL